MAKENEISKSKWPKKTRFGNTSVVLVHAYGRPRTFILVERARSGAKCRRAWQQGPTHEHMRVGPSGPWRSDGRPVAGVW
jgi:hypothetical protein